VVWATGSTHRWGGTSLKPSTPLLLFSPIFPLHRGIDFLLLHFVVVVVLSVVVGVVVVVVIGHPVMMLKG